MIDFKKILILMYFNEYQNSYLLSEISKLCNLSIPQLNEILSEMIFDNLIEIKNEIMQITTNGKSILKDNGYERVSLNSLDNDTITLKISDTKLSFDEIYIPIGFKP